MNLSCFLLLLLTSPFLIGAQKLQSSASSSSSSTPTTDFTCPEDFGYFPHPSDCTQYYVCVFGGALLESCTGGLMYSHDLQTCDWPRNVYCYNGTLPLDNNLEQQTSAQGRQQDRTIVRSRGGSSQQSTRSNPSYSYNPIKIETYGQLSRAAEESSISGGKKKVNLPDDEYQQQRSGRSYEGSLPNYKEEIYQQNSGSVCPACSRRAKRSIESIDHDEADYSSDELHRDDRALFEKEKHGNSIKNSEKDTQQTSYSHRVSSPGNILYPPSYYQTPTYGLVNIDKLRSSFSTSSKLRNNPPPRVVKITSSTTKPNIPDSTQTGSYFSSQHAQPHTILDYQAPTTAKHGDFAPPSPTSNYNTHQLVKPKSPPPTSYSYTPQQQQRWNHLITQKTQQQQQPPGQPGYYNGHHKDDKRIVLKTPSSPLLLPHQHQQHQQQHQPSSHNNVPFNEQEKRLSDFVTNAYLNRLKGSGPHDYHRSRPPHHNENKPNLPFLNFGARAPTTFGPSHHIHNHHHHHHQNHVQQIHQQVLPSKGSVSRGKYTGAPNKYYDNSPAVVAVPQQDDYAATDDLYANQRYAANVGNQTGQSSYYYSPAGATASAADDDDASYYVYDDEEEEVVPQQQQQPQKYTPTQDYKYSPQQPNPYTRGPQTQQPAQQIITRRPTITQQAPISPTTTRTSTRSRTRTSASSGSSSSSSTPTRSRPTNKPKSSIVKGQSAPVRDVYLDPPSRPENIYETPATNSPATKCRKDLCVLPDCSCGGKEIPGGLRAQETPQIVLLTFDDSVNDLNKNLYRDLFEKGRKNPNGCPISATFYVSHEWTDYSQVQNLAADGHEIASHSVSHSFGEQYSQKKWDREINGQREILAAYGGVKMSEIRGMRAPFLAIGGNNMFKMLHDSNFTYDSSMPIYENRPPSWPYTLDYRIFHDCMIPPCPTKSYAGVWEVPMVMWQDLKGGRCSMGDACSNPPTAEGVYQMLAKNFERHYTTNRAPFGLYYHAAWFTQPHHKEGFEAFLDTLVQMDDVWLVTNWQALQWIRNPTPNNRALNFAPWSCHDLKDRPPRCNHPKVCNLWHKSGVRYMKTCQQCPQQYPWTGNTGVPYSNSL